MIDPDGDEISAQISARAALGEPLFGGRQDYTGSSGKYEGIAGGHEFVCQAVGIE